MHECKQFTEVKPFSKSDKHDVFYRCLLCGLYRKEGLCDGHHSLFNGFCVRCGQYSDKFGT